MYDTADGDHTYHVYQVPNIFTAAVRTVAATCN